MTSWTARWTMRLAGLLWIPLAGCQGWTTGAVATPQRPTLSSDTNTTAKGTFEWESGVLVDRDDVFDLTNTLKFGASESTELFVSWSPYRVIEGRPDGRGPSDLGFGAQVRLREEEGDLPSVAVQLRSEVPTGDEDEGLGLIPRWEDSPSPDPREVFRK